MTCLMGCLHAAMKTKETSVTIGIDLGDCKHAICVLDARGEVIQQESIRNTRPSLTAPQGPDGGGCGNAQPMDEPLSQGSGASYAGAQPAQGQRDSQAHPGGEAWERWVIPMPSVVEKPWPQARQAPHRTIGIHPPTDRLS